MQVTRRPQALRTTPMLLAVTPLPSPLTTPPVTKTYFIVSFRFLSGKRAERLTLTAPAASAFMGQTVTVDRVAFPPLFLRINSSTKNRSVYIYTLSSVIFGEGIKWRIRIATVQTNRLISKLHLNSTNTGWWDEMRLGDYQVWSIKYEEATSDQCATGLLLWCLIWTSLSHHFCWMTNNSDS